MAKKRRFEIGDYVEFDEVAEFGYTESEAGVRKIKKRHPMSTGYFDKRELPPVIGQIVGCTTKKTGTTEYVDEYTRGFTATGHHLTWKVAIAFRGKHVLVLDEDIRPIDRPEGFRLPGVFLVFPWDDQARKVMSDCMKDVKRDAQGRFA